MKGGDCDTLHNPETIAYTKVKAPQEINKDPYVPEVNAREASRGTRFATCSLTKSAFGSPTRPGLLDARFENTQNLVSTNVPEVIESPRASCNGNGIDMAKVK